MLPVTRDSSGMSTSGFYGGFLPNEFFFFVNLDYEIFFIGGCTFSFLSVRFRMRYGASSSYQVESLRKKEKTETHRTVEVHPLFFSMLLLNSRVLRLLPKTDFGDFGKKSKNCYDTE